MSSSPIVKCGTLGDHSLALHIGPKGEMVVPVRQVELTENKLRVAYTSPETRRVFKQLLAKVNDWTGRELYRKGEPYPTETITMSFMGVDFVIEGASLVTVYYLPEGPLKVVSEEGVFVFDSLKTSRKVPVYESQV